MYQKLKLDNRVMFTRECVFIALDKLLKKKKFDSITINEIVEVSGVSRATFYRNYKSKEEIIEKRLELVTREAFLEMNDKYKDINISNEEGLQLMISTMSSNSSLLECIKHANMDALILNELSNIFKWYAHNYYKESIKDKIEFDYIVSMVSGAVWNIFSTWIDRDKKETPEELSRILFNFFTEVSGALIKSNS